MTRHKKTFDLINVMRHNKSTSRTGDAAMKDTNDQQTADLFQGQYRRRGRPVTGTAKTDAERARAYRLRKKQRQTVARIEDVHAGLAVQDAAYDRIDELEKLVAELKNKNSVLEIQVKALTEYKHGLISVQKQKDSTHKGQITKLRNQIHALEIRVQSAIASGFLSK